MTKQAYSRGHTAKRRASKGQRYGVPKAALVAASVPLLVTLLSALLTGDEEAPVRLPDDPLQRCAFRALRGDFGKLADWQRRGYAAALEKGVRVQGRAWVTSYFPSEGFPRGQSTRSGKGVSERSAAVAARRWNQYGGRFVWTAAYGLRIVEDTGANSNDQVARAKGAALWLDYWFPHGRPANPVTPYAVY